MRKIQTPTNTVVVVGNYICEFSHDVRKCGSSDAAEIIRLLAGYQMLRGHIKTLTFEHDTCWTAESSAPVINPRRLVNLANRGARINYLFRWLMKARKVLLRKTVRTGADWKLEPTYNIWNMIPELASLDDDLKAYMGKTIDLYGDLDTMRNLTPIEDEFEKKFGAMVGVGDAHAHECGIVSDLIHVCRCWIRVIDFCLDDELEYTIGDIVTKFMFQLCSSTRLSALWEKKLGAIRDYRQAQRDTTDFESAHARCGIVHRAELHTNSRASSL